MGYKWVACCGGDIAPHAAVAGHDSDGDALYVGRASHGGDNLPAKVIPNKGKAYVCHSGREIEVDSYEVLCGQHYEWVATSNGGLPPGALTVGLTASGEPLYAGRGHWKGSLTVGKVHPSHGCLYIPFGGQEVKLSEYEVLSQPDQWIAATAHSMPENAVRGGHDVDGDVIYVGRASHEGELMPAKVIPHKGGAYVCWAGQEIKVNEFQVLVGGQDDFQWTPCEKGRTVPNAVAVGTARDGETLYVGRAEHSGSLCVGKVHPSHGCLYLPFGGAEVRKESYQLLVRT